MTGHRFYYKLIQSMRGHNSKFVGRMQAGARKCPVKCERITYDKSISKKKKNTYRRSQHRNTEYATYKIIKNII